MGHSDDIFIYGQVVLILDLIFGALLFSAAIQHERNTCRFSRPGSSHQDVDFLEDMLIAMALEKNPKLINSKKTSFWRDMRVPGILNGKPGRANLSVHDLKNALGKKSPQVPIMEVEVGVV